MSILSDLLTSDVEIPMSAKLIGGGLFVLALGWITYGIASQQQNEATCFPHAKTWVESMLDPLGTLHDPKQAEFYAKQLATYNLACPKGHIIVRQTEPRSIPEGIVKLSQQPRIIEAARASMAVEDRKER